MKTETRKLYSRDF